MRTTKDWKLPKPEETEEGYNWKPVVRVGRTIPFGYKQDENDKDLLLPIPTELELLEKAKKFIKQYSYRQVADWLTTQTGRKISHVGLIKRIKIEQKRKSEASTQRYLAERYKEALQKAEKLEAKSPNSPVEVLVQSCCQFTKRRGFPAAAQTHDATGRMRAAHRCRSCRGSCATTRSRSATLAAPTPRIAGAARHASVRSARDASTRQRPYCHHRILCGPCRSGETYRLLRQQVGCGRFR